MVVLGLAERRQMVASVYRTRDRARWVHGACRLLRMQKPTVQNLVPNKPGAPEQSPRAHRQPARARC